MVILKRNSLVHGDHFSIADEFSFSSIFNYHRFYFLISLFLYILILYGILSANELLCVFMNDYFSGI